MSKDEAVVRAAWDGVTAGPDIYGYAITLPTRPPHTFVGFERKREAWAAVRKFTDDHKEAIRLVEEEIRILVEQEILIIDKLLFEDVAAMDRIIRREREHLETLRKGMK